MNIINLLNYGSRELQGNNITSYKIDSELLLARVLRKTREEIIINSEEKVSDKKTQEFFNLINRRSKREPIAYIFKEKEFWSKKFLVDKNTLIPRPETELLVEKILKFFPNKRLNILDIGTGTGCVIISILSELKRSKGIGIDLSQEAIKVAKLNAIKHKLTRRVIFKKKNLEDNFNKKFDLIVSNPPYIMKKDLRNLQDDIKKFEPKLALDGGNDGLDVIKKVIYKSIKLLKINGILALEIGNGQYKQVSKILRSNNFILKELVKDYQENIRCIISTLKN